MNRLPVVSKELMDKIREEVAQEENAADVAAEVFWNEWVAANPAMKCFLKNALPMFCDITTKTGDPVHAFDVALMGLLYPINRAMEEAELAKLLGNEPAEPVKAHKKRWWPW